MMGDTGPDPAVEAENVIKEWMEQVPFSRKVRTVVSINVFLHLNKEGLLNDPLCACHASHSMVTGMWHCHDRSR